MIAQDIVRAEDFPKEWRIGDYGRLRKILCADKRQARACGIHGICGLNLLMENRHRLLDRRTP